MRNEAFEDKRILEALNFIDERFIAEVTEDYEVFDLPGEYKPNRKRVFRAYRQFIALAACLILLTGAFPVIINIVRGAFDFMAGMGSGATEDNNTTEIDSPYERAIDAYPEGMPAEEIYADVIKGGWVVNYDYSGIIYGENLWNDFLAKVDRGEPAKILIAEYPATYSSNGETTIGLHEVVYDGQLFTHIGGEHYYINDVLDAMNIFTFKRLVTIEYDMVDIIDKEVIDLNKTCFMWVLTNNDKEPYTMEDYGDELFSGKGGIGQHETILSFYYEKD